MLILHRLFEMKNSMAHRRVEKRVWFGFLSKQPLKLVSFDLQQDIANKVNNVQDQVLPVSNRDPGPETSLSPLKKYLSTGDCSCYDLVSCANYCLSVFASVS